jgi:hypothetical protein
MSTTSAATSPGTHPYILKMEIFENVKAEQCGSYFAVKSINIYKNDGTVDQNGINGKVFQYIEKKTVGVTPQGVLVRGKDDFFKITKNKHTNPEYEYINNGKMVDEHGNIIDDGYGNGAISPYKGQTAMLDPSIPRMTARVVQCGNAVFISDTKLSTIQSTVDLFKVHSPLHASNGLLYVENTQTQLDLINQTWRILTSVSESGPPVCDIIQSEFSDTTLGKGHGRTDYNCDLTEDEVRLMRRQRTVGNNTDPIIVSNQIIANLSGPQSNVISTTEAHLTSENPNGNKNFKGPLYKKKGGGKSKKRRRTNKKRKTKRRRRRTYKYKK